MERLNARGGKPIRKLLTVVQTIGNEGIGQASNNVNRKEEMGTAEVELTFLVNLLHLISMIEKEKLKLIMKWHV